MLTMHHVWSGGRSGRGRELTGGLEVEDNARVCNGR